MASGRQGENDRERGVYIISVAAELAGVHPQTLRIYERKQLIEPERTSGNTRRYSEHDVERLRKIQQLTQEEKVNLAGVRMVMDLEDRLEEMELELERARRWLRESERRLRELSRRRGMLVPLRDAARRFGEGGEGGPR
jgi:MerR family transcriptional regulator/heat shock protein HspR